MKEELLEVGVSPRLYLPHLGCGGSQLTPVEAGGPDCATALWVPSVKGIDEWGRQRIRMTGIFHLNLLWPHVLSCRLWYYITFPKMVSIRVERERICRNVYLSTAREFRTLWIEGSRPRIRTGKRNQVMLGHQSKGRGSLPRSSRLDLSLPGHLSSITYGSPGLLCFFTVLFL